MVTDCLAAQLSSAEIMVFGVGPFQSVKVFLDCNKKPSETGDAPQRFFVTILHYIFNKRKRLEGHYFGQNIRISSR
ncbi:hypothetical protein DPMN_059546 [Dreissena polymorpha]|uniref:Uncharacterized protein n=1 Tax=Dreissena polymorpha TaxID=45954 RepID=A0A9D4C3P5_DREPO|nr:hypothetical protein DPMN_059546 [Dreissena polymorpha]